MRISSPSSTSSHGENDGGLNLERDHNLFKCSNIAMVPWAEGGEHKVSLIYITKIDQPSSTSIERKSL